MKTLHIEFESDSNEPTYGIQFIFNESNYILGARKWKGDSLLNKSNNFCTLCERHVSPSLEKCTHRRSPLSYVMNLDNLGILDNPVLAWWWINNDAPTVSPLWHKLSSDAIEYVESWLNYRSILGNVKEERNDLRLDRLSARIEEALGRFENLEKIFTDLYSVSSRISDVFQDQYDMFKAISKEVEGLKNGQD